MLSLKGKEVISMAKLPCADREQVKASLGSSGLGGHICWFLGAIFAVLGIISDAMNTSLGLEPISWFLLAIAAFLASLAYLIGWAVSWYLETTEAKKKE